MMDLNLFDDDKSIKLAIDRGELDEIYNTLKDLINGEVIKPTPNNKNTRYYKDQINIIEEYFFRINNRINFNPKEIFDMSKEDRLSSTLRKRSDFLKEIRTPPKQRPKRNKPKSPLVERIPDKAPRRDRPRGRPPSRKGAPGDELMIEKINKSEFMKIIPSKYKFMNDLDELQNYWTDADKVADNIRKIEDENLRRKTEKRYEDRYKAIQLRSDDL